MIDQLVREASTERGSLTCVFKYVDEEALGLVQVKG